LLKKSGKRCTVIVRFLLKSQLLPTGFEKKNWNFKLFKLADPGTRGQTQLRFLFFYISSKNIQIPLLRLQTIMFNPLVKNSSLKTANQHYCKFAIISLLHLNDVINRFYLCVRSKPCIHNKLSYNNFVDKKTKVRDLYLVLICLLLNLNFKHNFEGDRVNFWHAIYYKRTSVLLSSFVNDLM
jgi:hypothetical protein